MNIRLAIACVILASMTAFGCDEDSSGCDAVHSCSGNWVAACAGDAINHICSTDGFICAIPCTQACVEHGYSSYAGSCSYDVNAGKDTCWCN